MKHLSIADLAVAVFQVLPQLLWDITFRFYGPDLLCRLVKYLQVVGMFASTYLLLLMSLDRCLAICQPLRSLRCRTDRLAVLRHLARLPGGQRAGGAHLRCARWPTASSTAGPFSIQPWGPKAYITWITLAVYIVPVNALPPATALSASRSANLRLKTEAAAAEAAAGAEGAAADCAGRAALARVSNVASSLRLRSARSR